ncbi:hypothetical protein [Desulfobulbus oralis]|uniref:hypothetical protein n=1 Tax=Desulfobulbus oralis TaxID=1986146 RepID=UPI001FE26141|nr:hypothetical protein [Desulfobulbus oralis]
MSLPVNFTVHLFFKAAPCNNCSIIVALSSVVGIHKPIKHCSDLGIGHCKCRYSSPCCRIDSRIKQGCQSVISSLASRTSVCLSGSQRVSVQHTLGRIEFLLGRIALLPGRRQGGWAGCRVIQYSQSGIEIISSCVQILSGHSCGSLNQIFDRSCCHLIGGIHSAQHPIKNMIIPTTINIKTNTNGDQWIMTSIRIIIRIKIWSLSKSLQLFDQNITQFFVLLVS